VYELRTFYFLVIAVIVTYFSVMYLATTITLEGLEDTYHLGSEIKFTVKVKGFGDAVPSYSVGFQKEDNPGMVMGGVGSTGSVDLSYLNFPLPFEKTINYSYTTNIYNDSPGTYVMKFSTLGHTVEKKITLLS
jgi:hypothetical protein